MIDQATKKIAVISSYLLPGCNLHDSVGNRLSKRFVIHQQEWRSSNNEAIFYQAFNRLKEDQDEDACTRKSLILDG